jgi:hypothetical protein
VHHAGSQEGSGFSRSHPVLRCVRRAFLCGKDHFSGKDFEHRRQWIEVWLLDLSAFFVIDIAAYAIMSNHYHVVLHINKKRANNWSHIEVCERWHALFSGNDLSGRYLKRPRAKSNRRTTAVGVSRSMARSPDRYQLVYALPERTHRQSGKS